MNKPRWYPKSHEIVAVYAVVSLVCAAIATAWPNRWVHALTVVPAFFSGAMAAGFGLYGIMRYPSLRMLVASTAAVVACVWGTTLMWHVATLPPYSEAD